MPIWSAGFWVAMTKKGSGCGGLGVGAPAVAAVAAFGPIGAAGGEVLDAVVVSVPDVVAFEELAAGVV